MKRVIKVNLMAVGISPDELVAFLTEHFIIDASGVSSNWSELNIVIQPKIEE